MLCASARLLRPPDVVSSALDCGCRAGMFHLFPITWLQPMRLRLFYCLLAERCIQANKLPIVLSDITWWQRPHRYHVLSVVKPRVPLMSPAELSSIKWENDGEMSAQDTWTLVKKLTKVEEQDKASNLLHLSSKHSHSKRSNRR